MPDEFILTFADGVVMGLYDDAALPILLDLGPVEITRASDVEPDGGGWSAVIRPWVPGGSVTLGPFPTRREALEAEVSHLMEVL